MRDFGRIKGKEKEEGKEHWQIFFFIGTNPDGGPTLANMAGSQIRTLFQCSERAWPRLRFVGKLAD
jgi:hypothetical protein